MGGPGWAMRLPPPHRNAATGTWLDCGTTTGCPTLHLVVAANIHPLPKKKGRRGDVAAPEGRVAGERCVAVRSRMYVGAEVRVESVFKFF